MAEESKKEGTSTEKAVPAKKRRLVMPDTYIIVAFIVLVMAALTWVIPPGTYDYQEVDVAGRTKMYEAIVKGQNAMDAGLPESFNVLVKELQSFCLDVELLEAEEEK